MSADVISVYNRIMKHAYAVEFGNLNLLAMLSVPLSQKYFFSLQQ